MEYLGRIFQRVFKKSKPSEEEILEEETHPGGEEEKEGIKLQEQKYDPSQILIKYRARASDSSIDLNHDFTDIPAKDELEEMFGPGLFVIYVKELEDTHPKIKKRFKIEGNPILPVESYEIKVRVSEGGKLLDTDVTFPAGNPPSKEEIITALGGGGTIKLNAKGKDGRIIWSDWRDYTDQEPPEALKKKDDTFKGKLESALDGVRKGAEDKAIEEISGKGGSKSRFDTAISQLTEVVEDKRFQKLEDALARFTHEVKGSAAGGAKESKSLTELAFKEPYMAKLEAQKTIIAEMAKTNPTEAMKMLDKMPDGVTIGLRLALAGTGFIEAFTDFMKEESRSLRGRPKEKKEEVEKKEKKEEAAAAEVGKELQDKLEQKSRLGVEENVTPTGFDLNFNIGEEV